MTPSLRKRSANSSTTANNATIATSRRHSTNALSQLADIILTAASWVSVAGLWVCAFSAYVSPDMLRITSIIGLAFPLMLCGTLLFLFLSLLFAPRRCWICLLGLLLCIGSVRSYFPINPLEAEADEAHALTVMTYNCHGFPGVTTDEPKREILQYIDSTNPDIFVYQEGNNSVEDWHKLFPAYTKRFPYHEEPFKDKDITTHQGIYSRYPIFRTELITAHTKNAVVAFWLRMPKGDSLLVLNVHLKSNNLTPEDRTQYSNMVKQNHSKQNPDSALLTSRTLASKIASAAGIRALMADTIADYLEHYIDVPTIVCGDFNDTPISYSTYRMKRCGLNDAFRMAGNGMGRSFNKDAILVRIDHQFCSDHFKPVRATIDKTPQWSDHYPLIVTYNINTRAKKDKEKKKNI